MQMTSAPLLLSSGRSVFLSPGGMWFIFRSVFGEEKSARDGWRQLVTFYKHVIYGSYYVAKGINQAITQRIWSMTIGQYRVPWKGCYMGITEDNFARNSKEREGSG